MDAIRWATIRLTGGTRDNNFPLASNVERAVLAVRRMARLAAAEVSRWNTLAIALMSQQLNEPSLVLDLFIQNARSQIISARIFSEGHVTNLYPTSDRTTL